MEKEKAFAKGEGRIFKGFFCGAALVGFFGVVTVT